jgi:endonuclease/exonuclease/phosphatase family metal-dependent hydrolase
MVSHRRTNTRIARWRFEVKTILALLVVLAQSMCFEVEASEPAPLSVMTFNIRYGTAQDGDNAWPHRKNLTFGVIATHKPQILGLQEAEREQLDEILQEFPQFSSLGVGRDADGSGEYSPLLYDRKRFDVLEAETFWLSETPTVRASTHWGNSITRVCTWARLLERESNTIIRIYNTHWDHESQPSRLKSGELIAKRIREQDSTEPLIVMGDFNVGPLDPARVPLNEIGLRDSFVDVHPDQARMGTFHAFTGKSESDKIDAILINKAWRVTDAEIITTHRGNVFPSDHYPVSAVLDLKARK